MTAFEGIIFVLQAYTSTIPIYSFIILFVNVCSKLNLIMKENIRKMETSDVSGTFLKECDIFFNSGIRQANEIFSTFLFCIVGPYLLLITFGSYSALFGILQMKSMSDICFGFSQVFITFYLISIVFMINYFSHEVSSNFHNYKVCMYFINS